MSAPLQTLQDLEAESYWPEEYLIEAAPLLADWLVRPLEPADLDAVNRCMNVVSDLDVTDNAPFAALWALRSTGAMPAVGDLDQNLTDWREWIQEDYYDGEVLDLPPLATTEAHP